MKNLKFKTNINCGNCVRTISSLIDGNIEIEKWDVDLNSPDRVLYVEVIDDIIPEDIINDLGKLGFSAEEIN